MYADICRYDAKLIGFDSEPSINFPSIRKKEFELVISARIIIFLSLGDSPLAKVRHLIDDGSISARQLWDELETVYKPQMHKRFLIFVKIWMNSVIRRESNGTIISIRSMHFSIYYPPTKKSSAAGKSLLSPYVKSLSR